MNKDAFYASLRSSASVFGTPLGQRQVDGIEALLREDLREIRDDIKELLKR